MRKEEEKQKMNRSDLYIDFIVHFNEEMVSVNISDSEEVASVNMNSDNKEMITLITKNSEEVISVNTVSSDEEMIILNTKNSVKVMSVNTDDAS